jgi:hypothetical protein
MNYLGPPLDHCFMANTLFAVPVRKVICVFMQMIGVFLWIYRTFVFISSILRPDDGPYSLIVMRQRYGLQGKIEKAKKKKKTRWK